MGRGARRNVRAREALPGRPSAAPWWWLGAALAVLWAAGEPGRAAAGAVQIQITGTVVTLALVNPVPERWEFTLEGQLRQVQQDFLFRDPNYTSGTYYLVVRSNTPLALSLEGQGVTVGSASYPATFEWSLEANSEGILERSACTLPTDSPCRFYSSSRPVTSARLNLGNFYIVYTEPVASGALRGEIVVTVST